MTPLNNSHARQPEVAARLGELAAVLETGQPMQTLPEISTCRRTFQAKI